MRRVLEWWKICLDCGVFQKGEDEYIGMSFWYCTKCNSKRIKGGFTVYERNVDSCN